MHLFINGEGKTFDAPLSLARLIEQLGMKGDRVAVELNREIVARAQWAETQLNDGDRLEIVHFVGGGSGDPFCRCLAGSSKNLQFCHPERAAAFAASRRAPIRLQLSGSDRGPSTPAATGQAIAVTLRLCSRLKAPLPRCIWMYFSNPASGPLRLTAIPITSRASANSQLPIFAARLKGQCFHPSPTSRQIS